MAGQCHQENLASVQAIEDTKNLNIRKCFQEMKDISHTKAHVDKMLDGNLYMEFFEKIKNIYERNTERTAEELIHDMDGNYSRMTEHMRSMFQEIGGYAAGIGNEKFYREYVSGKEEIQHKLLGEAHMEDFGGSAITEFAQKTRERINKIVKKLQRKKIFFLMLPMLILMVLFLGAAFAKYQSVKNSDYAIEKETEEEGGLELKIKSWVEEKIIEDNFLIAFAYAAVGVFVGLGSILIFLALLLAVLYVIYTRMIKAWCYRRICANCEEYLRRELDQFGQERAMYEKARKAIEHIAEEYEQQYLGIWNRIFQETRYETPEKMPEIENLQNEWEELKYRSL